MVRGIGNYKTKKVKRKRNPNKIQSKEMEKDIERSKYISEAWLQGGKAIGESMRPRKKEKKK